MCALGRVRRCEKLFRHAKRASGIADVAEWNVVPDSTKPPGAKDLTSCIRTSVAISNCFFSVWKRTRRTRRHTVTAVRADLFPACAAHARIFLAADAPDGKPGKSLVLSFVRSRIRARVRKRRALHGNFVAQSDCQRDTIYTSPSSIAHTPRMPVLIPGCVVCSMSYTYLLLHRRRTAIRLQ